MANKFQIEITAVDKFTAVGKKIALGIKNMLSPVAKIGKEAGLSGFSGGVSKLAAVMEDVGVSGRFASGGILGIVGLTAAATAAVSRLALRTADYGVKVRLATANTGMATDTFQAMLLAQKSLGGSSDALQSGLKSLGDTLEDAVAGRNQEALALMNRLGIRMRHTKDGAVDVASAFEDISAAIAGIKNPQVQSLVARAFGLEEALPLLRQGKQGIRDLADEMKRYGAIQSPEQIARSNELYQSWQRLGFAARGIANKISEGWDPVFTGILDKMTAASNWLLKNSRPVIPIYAAGAGGPQSSGRGMGGGGGGGWGGTAPSGAAPAITPLGKKAATLGIRQNNPGNLRSWGGVPSANGYAQFPSMGQGLSALAQQLLLYRDRGVNTISAIVRKFAPPGENDTAAYISDVMHRMGRGADDKLDMSSADTISALMNAIVAHENKNFSFPADMVNRAVRERLARDRDVPSLYGGARDGAAANSAVPPVHVDIKVNNALPGTRVEVDKPDHVTTGTRLGFSLPGVNL